LSKQILFKSLFILPKNPGDWFFKEIGIMNIVDLRGGKNEVYKGASYAGRVLTSAY